MHPCAHILYLLLLGGLMNAQGVVHSGAYSFSIEDVSLYSSVVEYQRPPEAGDSDPVKLYKQYFNPGSLQQFRHFFLPGDWGGFTEADFVKWQDHLRSNSMQLEKSVRVRDQYKNIFLILQYRFESETHVIPSTAIFKNIQGEWKHISNVNDKQAQHLKEIGMIPPASIMDVHTFQRHADMSDRSWFSAMEPQEKFDRTSLFDRVQPLLKRHEIAPADLSTVKTLFQQKAEVEMIRFLCQTYDLDAYQLMAELNEAMGFPLFKYTTTIKN